jgi:glycosyltransferase involved in cell wall biosynthesis
MDSKPLVSAVIIFFNAERFLAEAIESVLNQTYRHWELLLVDDGSTDGSRALADRYAERHPERVQVLAHPGNENRGMGASRNRGIEFARGDYVAFLDADDVWRTNKLEEQVAILQRHPHVGMLYGETLYWFSWTQDPEGREHDYIPALRVPPDTAIAPPGLLPAYLRGRAAVPCTCSIVVKRSLIQSIGGFDETFVGIASIYEDQAFYAKVCLNDTVVAFDRCWDHYRQHAGSSTASARRAGEEAIARQFFLRWLENYLQEYRVADLSVWLALKREQWRLQQPSWLPSNRRLQGRVRWVKKWMLRVEERLFPAGLSYRLWGGPG